MAVNETMVGVTEGGYLSNETAKGGGGKGFEPAAKMTRVRDPHGTVGHYSIVPPILTSYGPCSLLGALHLALG